MTTTPKFIETKLIRRLTMWELDPNSPNKERAQMTFGLKGNNLEISVWTKGPNDKGRSPIKANLHALQVETLLQRIQQTVESTQKTNLSFEVKNGRPSNPEDPNSPKEEYVQSVFRIAKNSEGVVSIGLFDVTDETRSRILFPFVLDRWSGDHKENGQPIGLAKVSELVANGYIRILRSVMLENLEITSNEENKQRYERKQGGFGDKQKSTQSSAPKTNNNDFQDISF